VLIDEPLDHEVEVVRFFNEGFHLLTGVRGPVDLRTEVSQRLLFVFDFNDLVLDLAQLLIHRSGFSDALVRKFHELVLH
jgi:hypothetical protein